MPTWGELLKELQQLVKAKVALPEGTSPFDFLRRKYIAAMAQRTRRNVILYASKWTQPGANPALTSINDEDIHGFMEVVHGLGGDELDLVVHSPGGSAEATEAIVTYLRTKFQHIRLFVPHAAMSAATMLACAADRIVMGKHSFLGPIDPQFIFQTDGVISASPAQAILEQFALAQKECQNPALLGSWMPILRQYAPALIVQCKYAQELSRSLVSTWLARHMLRNDVERDKRATFIAGALSDHARYKSHGRFIPRDELRKLGLLIDDLESDQGLQDDALSIYHATSHTFNATNAVKIIENHLGKAFIKTQQTLAMQQVIEQRPFPPPPPQP